MTASERFASLRWRRSAWVGVVALALVVAATAPVPAATGGSGGFSDVPEGGTHEPAINALAEMGLFEGTGCGDGLFCPGEPVERWVMAVWLVRALGGEVTATGTSRFADVDAALWWSPYVEELAVRGITAGCKVDPLRYCPDGTVTRGQMATFLVTAFDLEPAESSAGFADVDLGSTHGADIDALFAAGVTAGCGTDPLRYCPGQAVKRGEMATFLHRALLEQEATESERSLIDSWLSAVSLTVGVWPGFNLADIPTVLVSVDVEGRVEAVVAFNHPSADALGSAILSVEVDGHRVAVVGELADPEGLASLAPFDFFADIGGTDTFVVVDEQGEPGFELGTPGFVALVAHEGFHRYQFDHWVPSTTPQDVEGYDFGADNLGLMLLENRILVAAYEADTSSDLERLARQFAAVRAARHARDPRVVLDEQQERIEGSARWIEHRIGDAIGFLNTSANHTRELGYLDQSLADPAAAVSSVKFLFGWVRFYSSGATLLALLNRLDVSGADIAERLGDGDTPAQLLEQRIAPLGDRENLVAAAWAEHDPDGRLGVAAAVLAEHAAREGEIDFGARLRPDETLGPGLEAGEDQIPCLQYHGLDLSADSVTIPDDIAGACLGGPGT